jgi:hypothetical protein
MQTIHSHTDGVVVTMQWLSKTLECNKVRRTKLHILQIDRGRPSTKLHILQIDRAVRLHSLQSSWSTTRTSFAENFGLLSSWWKAATAVTTTPPSR